MKQLEKRKELYEILKKEDIQKEKWIKDMEEPLDELEWTYQERLKDLRRQMNKAHTQNDLENMIRSIEQEINNHVRYIYVDNIKKYKKEMPEKLRKYNDKFYKYINKVVYSKQGENDEQPWELIGKIGKEYWFYFIATCDYSGFGCIGNEFKLYLSKGLKNLLIYGLSDQEVTKIEKKYKKRM